MEIKKLNLKFIEKFLDKNYFRILLLILLIAAILRFFNFSGHIAFQSDTTRDISIAKEALERGELPLTGSFSSAGSFVFGPLFYWFLMASYLLMPFSLFAPWIMTGIIGLLTVIAFGYLGKLIGGIKFSIILAILAAVSPQLVLSSLSLTQHSLVLISTVFMLIFFILFWQRTKLIFPFLMGLSLGVALSLHYQAINLFILLPVIFFLPKFKFIEKIKAFSLAIFGVLIVSAPILIWDARQNWANTLNILDYFLVAQYRIYVPNSWRIFLFTFFPEYWSQIVGGLKFVGFGLIFLIGTLFAILTLRRRGDLLIFYLGSIFFILTVLVRYYKGELGAGYLYYLAPFVLLFTAWLVDRVISSNMLPILGRKFNLNILLGGFLLIVVIIGNTYVLFPKIIYKNTQLQEINTAIIFLTSNYPNQKFIIYSYDAKFPNITYALSVFLEDKNKINKKGVPLGICKPHQCPLNAQPSTTLYEIPIYDLSYADLNKGLSHSHFRRVSQADIYDSTIGFLKQRKLKSTFHPTIYINEKLNAVF